MACLRWLFLKSVGEAMAMGRTFQESFQKAMRSLETGLDGWALPRNYKPRSKSELLFGLRQPNPSRMLQMKQAFNEGMTKEEIHDLTKIDPWFCAQFAELHEIDVWLKTATVADLTAEDFTNLKKKGYSDAQIGQYVGASAMEVRQARKAHGVEPSYKRVDTCAAEFSAETPYLYSSYDGALSKEPLPTRLVTHCSSFLKLRRGLRRLLLCADLRGFRVSFRCITRVLRGQAHH
jgi:carbamoyl-phosphate synthase large subunit